MAAAATISATRAFIDKFRGLGHDGEFAQLSRALDLAEEHDARAVKPVMPERPLQERAVAALRTYGIQLPLATADLFSQALSRLGVLERERNSPPRPGIQVKVADDLEVMSLEELCGRFNAQRQSIKEMYAAQNRMDGKLRAIRELSTET